MHAAAHGACDMEILDGGSLNPREGSNIVIVTACDFNRQGVSVAVKDAFERYAAAVTGRIDSACRGQTGLPLLGREGAGIQEEENIRI